MPSPCLSFCLPSYPSLCVSRCLRPPHGAGPAWEEAGPAWEEAWQSHTQSRSSEAQLSLHPFTLWSGGTLTCRAPTLSPEGSHLWWPLLSLSLTPRPVASPPSCAPRGLLTHAASLHGLLGEERDVTPPHVTTAAQTPFRPRPPLRTTTSVSFINSRLFRNKPSLYRTAPLQFTWGPLSPKPLFLLF